MDQVFAVRQDSEKYLANGKDVSWAFMNSEKAYDTIDRHGMWQMLKCRSWRKIVESSAQFLYR